MLIVSIAVISGRQEGLQRVVDSVLAQTVRPHKLFIYYSLEAWHLDGGWSRAPYLGKHPSIEIVRVPNIGSSRKYLYSISTFKEVNATIILLDDDRIWHATVFERLLRFSMMSDCVATTRGWTRYKLIENADGIPIFHDLPINGSQVLHPTQVSVANSGWATCFRTSHVLPELFSDRLQSRCELKYSDEIVLSSMLSRPKYVVPMPRNFYTDLHSSIHQWRSPVTTAAKLTQLRLLSGKEK
jgi:hypothetical protein